MNICSAGHDEIVYEGTPCPLCESIAEAEEAIMKVADLEKELEERPAEAAECITT